MGLGNTFTRSIIREIGRNYGKAVSNSLLGDKHSTPIRMVGNSNDVTRKRGTKYHNKLDELLQKLSIKGATATFNQGQNIYNAYFELVEEAQAGLVLIKILTLEYPFLLAVATQTVIKTSLCSYKLRSEVDSLHKLRQLASSLQFFRFLVIVLLAYSPILFDLSL